MNNNRLKIFLLISPFLVLILSKFGVLLSINYFQSEISWLPAFVGYYISIAFTIFIASRYFSLSLKEIVPLSLKHLPKLWTLFWAVIIPALLPLPAFILQAKNVPLAFIFYIIIFACINPTFEESFWRGLLNFLPGNDAFRILYSAALFSFSHYFLWGFWFKTLPIILPTVIATFIMGVLWMWFMQKRKNLAYPVLSHFFVDIFNLSVAVYCGLIT